MPKFDMKGPRGLGPMTGRGLGKCAKGKEKFAEEYDEGMDYTSDVVGKILGKKDKE